MLTTTEGESTPILIVRDAWLLDLGRKPYREVWELQKALVNRRAEDKIPDGLILVEHDRVATLGRPVDLEDVKASVIVHFQAVFGVTFRRVNLSELLPEPSSGRRPRRP